MGPAPAWEGVVLIMLVDVGRSWLCEGLFPAQSILGSIRKGDEEWYVRIVFHFQWYTYLGQLLQAPATVTSPAQRDCTLDLWARISPFSLKLLLTEYFIPGTEEKLRRIATYMCNRDARTMQLPLLFRKKTHLVCAGIGIFNCPFFAVWKWIWERPSP